MIPSIRTVCTRQAEPNPPRRTTRLARKLLCSLTLAAGFTTSAQAATYNWNNPTAGTYAWESTTDWDLAPAYPNGAGDSALVSTGNSEWDMTTSPITLGTLIMGCPAGSSGGGGTHTVKGTTLVFDNGTSHALLSVGDVSWGATKLEFTDITLNSTLDIDSTAWIFANPDIYGKIGGTGGLNIIRSDGDYMWPGTQIHGAHTYTGDTTIGTGPPAGWIPTLTLLPDALGNDPSIAGNVILNGGSLRIGNLSAMKSQSAVIGGTISGTGQIWVPEGGGMIFDNDANSWDGTLTTSGNFPAGLKYTSIKNAGAGPSALGNPSTPASGTINLSGVGVGPFEYIGEGAAETDRIIAINTAGDAEWSATVAASGTGPLKITSDLAGNGTSYFYLGGTGAGEWAGALSDRPGRALRIRKVGTGTWTLSGTNTYTDTTEVQDGTLILAPTGHLRFKLTNSSTNRITGSGTVQFDGIFDIDTSAVSAYVGSWHLVDVTSLNETFGATFSVADFTYDPVSSLWTKSDGKLWSFDPSTGDLTVSATALITSFTYGVSSGNINQSALPNPTITMVVPHGTNFATINPSYTLSSGSCDQPNGGVPTPNFSGGTSTYTVTDGAVSTVYTVTVTEAPAGPGNVGAGLSLWLDASASGTMTTSGETVTEWRDAAGGTGKMTATGSPTLVTSGIGGIPTVHFDTSSYMNDGVDRSAGPVTVFLVARETGGSNQRVLASANNNWLLGYWGNNFDSFYFEGDVHLGGTTSDTNPHLHAATLDVSGGTYTVYSNGDLVTSNGNGSQGPNNLQLNGSGFGEYSDCDISEVIVYDRILSEGELNAVGSYLAAKYSITTSYPPIEPTSLTYANWASTEYPTFDLTDPAADLDGDGMTNQQEYAYGLNPTTGASSNPIAVPLDPAAGTFSYTRTSNTDLTYSVWTSPDLQTWTKDATATQTAGTPVDGVETVAVTLSTVPTGTKLFVRVQAE